MSERQIAFDTIYYSALFHLVIVEVLFATIGFIGFLDVSVVASVTMLILQAIAFFISLILWLVALRLLSKYSVVTVVTGCSRSEISDRGSSVMSSASSYFFICTVIHVIFLLTWAIWLFKFGDLSTLNFVTNFGPFIIKLIILSLQFVVFFIVLLYFIADIRHQSLTQNVRSCVSTLKASQKQASSQQL